MTVSVLIIVLFPFFWHSSPQCLSHRRCFPLSSYRVSHSFALLGPSEETTVNLTVCPHFLKTRWSTQPQRDSAILPQTPHKLACTCRCNLCQRTVEAVEDLQLKKDEYPSSQKEREEDYQNRK